MGADRRRGARAGALLTGLVGIAALACAGASHHRGFRSDQYPVEVVTTQVGGKNVFVPSTIVVTAGGMRTLSIYNTTDAPHGFAIGGLGVQLVLPPQQETRVELPALEGHRVYRIGCHLHPPHRGATLVVLPGR